MPRSQASGGPRGTARPARRGAARSRPTGHHPCLPRRDRAAPGGGAGGGGVGGGGAPAAAATGREQFLVPVVTPFVGSGNQAAEFASAAVVARLLNRTLCLPPFRTGPAKHFRSTDKIPLVGDRKTGKASLLIANQQVISTQDCAASGWWDGRYGYEVGERYDLRRLARFVRVASVAACLARCNATADGVWQMRKRSKRPALPPWQPASLARSTLRLNWAFLRWTSPADVVAAMGGRQERCAALLGIFPGLRWRGAYLAVAPFLAPARPISRAAQRLCDQVFGTGTAFLAGKRVVCVCAAAAPACISFPPFPSSSTKAGSWPPVACSPPSNAFLRAVLMKGISRLLLKYADVNPNVSMKVHWRFNEAECTGDGQGLCFGRCEDGSNTNDPTSHPANVTWTDLADHEGCQPGTSGRSHHAGVLVTVPDLVDAIVDAASGNNVTAVYIATDGWLPGRGRCDLVARVVLTLREQGFAVAGLWRCPSLPCFPDGSTPDLLQIGTLFGIDRENFQPGNHLVSQLEQEVAKRAAAFLGSGQSSWSLAVWRTRMALRRAAEFGASWQSATATDSEGSEGGEDSRNEALQRAFDDALVEELLKDQRVAGLQCKSGYKGSGQPRQSMAPAAGEHPLGGGQEQGPDGWLDYVACEGRLALGGSCKVNYCS
eukprot:SM000010S04359  [mRNA]  locus=s10:1088262:1091985:- [translate_table: standard]